MGRPRKPFDELSASGRRSRRQRDERDIDENLIAVLVPDRFVELAIKQGIVAEGQIGFPGSPNVQRNLGNFILRLAAAAGIWDASQ